MFGLLYVHDKQGNYNQRKTLNTYLVCSRD